jgi:hypothetical protein
MAGEVIDGTFYEGELQKSIVPKNKVYQIEEVLEIKSSVTSQKVLVR